MLVVNDIHVHYGSAHVLHGVGLDVQAGQIVCLVGRNGAGKSTMLKAIMGIVSLSGGSIFFRGDRIDGRAPHAIATRGLAWVPEDRRVFGSLSVEENIRVAAQAMYRGNSGRRVKEALEFFPDLLSRARSLAKNLSGGQQQMLAISRALASRPELLMLDEPTEGLAPSMVKAIRDGILASRERGVSVWSSKIFGWRCPWATCSSSLAVEAWYSGGAGTSSTRHRKSSASTSESDVSRTQASARAGVSAGDRTKERYKRCYAIFTVEISRVVYNRRHEEDHSHLLAGRVHFLAGVMEQDVVRTGAESTTSFSGNEIARFC